MKRLFFYLIVTFVLLYLCTGCVVFNGQSLVNERRYVRDLDGCGPQKILYIWKMYGRFPDMRAAFYLQTNSDTISVVGIHSWEPAHYSGMGANDMYYTLEAKRYQLRISDGEKTIIVSKKNICQ